MSHTELNITTPLVVFDLETTGTNISKDRIVEIATIKVMPDGNINEKTRRVNPTIPIPEETSKIHGIYDKDVKNEPPFRKIAKSLAQYLDGCDLAGFNCTNFDVPVLVEEFLRANINFEIDKRKIIDASRIFNIMEKRNLRSALKFYCQEELVDAHTALADTRATYKVLLAQVKQYENQKIYDNLGEEINSFQNDMGVLDQICMSNKVDLAGRMIYNKDQKELFNFGKHKGKSVEEVLKREPNYYDWMMKGDFPLDTKKKITEIKLRYSQK